MVSVRQSGLVLREWGYGFAQPITTVWLSMGCPLVESTVSVSMEWEAILAFAVQVLLDCCAMKLLPFLRNLQLLLLILKAKKLTCPVQLTSAAAPLERNQSPTGGTGIRSCLQMLSFHSFTYRRFCLRAEAVMSVKQQTLLTLSFLNQHW